MALKLKYTDEHGILHINMSPSSTPRTENLTNDVEKQQLVTSDTMKTRNDAYDLLNSKYDTSDSSGEAIERTSLFRSRYNSIEQELANTPYAFTNRYSNNLDITIKNRPLDSPSKDIEDDRFFNRNLNLDCDSLFGPQLDFETTYSSNEESPAFTVKQLIHAQDRYFDLSSRLSNYTDSIPKSEPEANRDRSNFENKQFNKKVTNLNSKKDAPISNVRTLPPKSDVSVKKLSRTFENRKDAKRTVKIADKVASAEKSGEFSKKDGAFKVLLVDNEKGVKADQDVERATPTLPVLPTSKRKRESSFVIIADTPSRPSSPRSLPLETRSGRTSPFRGRGFRADTSRHTTPRTSAANSRACSPNRRRTSSLSRIDTMAQIATLPAFHIRPHSPRNFVKENIKEVQELSELNREKHEAEAERMRREEEEALLREMGLYDKETKGSKSNSRASSPGKKLRSRSNSPTALLQYEVPINDDGVKTVERKSRVKSVSKSQPQSNNGSPAHSKIPKRQSSVSPSRTVTRKIENNLNKNQRFISNSTSSINESIKIGSSVHDKRGKSQSTLNLNISPAHIRGKPPISPMKYGPPPTNSAINPKRLSPIVGTPNKSPDTTSKPNSSRMPKTPLKKSVKTMVNAVPIKTNVKTAAKVTNRDPSPDKRKVLPKETKPVNRTPSNRVTKSVNVNNNKSEMKKPISRTSSVKSLVRAPSTKTLNENPNTLKKVDSKKDLRAKTQSTNKINEVGSKVNGIVNGDIKKDKGATKLVVPAKPENASNDLNAKQVEQTAAQNQIVPESAESIKNNTEDVQTQDNETQYDKMANDKDELVIMTKKNVVSMTTAAITSQPLEVVTTVTNQLPAAFEKAREKGIFERHSSKDSLGAKNDDGEIIEDKLSETPKGSKVKELKTIFLEENIKLKPLQPPYNNPQVERVKQKIDNILKSPEVSPENILAAAAAEVKETKASFKNIADKTKNDIKQTKNEVTNKFTDIKQQALKQDAKFTEEIRSEATKIIDSIITPVEEPVEVKQSPKEAPKKEIEPIIMVVNERKSPNDFKENITQTMVKGEADVENQSLNMSIGKDKIGVKNKMVDAGSEQSSQSNGGLPRSTSTTPKPPERQKRAKSTPQNQNNASKMAAEDSTQKKEPLAKRILSKCAKGTKCCACCMKPEDDEQGNKDGVQKKEEIQDGGLKKGILSKMNCCKKKEVEVKEQMAKEIEKAAGKAIIEIESEVKQKRKLRDVICCHRARRISDSSVLEAVRVEGVKAADGVKVEGLDDEVQPGCCGRKKMKLRRDSILSDRSTTTCCNNRVANWFRGKCRRRSEIPVSRRPSMFSKNKSLSPTLPPEDTRSKLDPSLLEHTSFMRAAIPVLKVPLAAICLTANVIVPGLGTILSGLFCLCFGIPRFGIHDGAKYRIGGLLVNLIVGCFQLFTVIFCLVGWGWSIWWGVIMFRLARKYRKLKQEAAQAMEEETSASPPITDGNHATQPA